MNLWGHRFSQNANQELQGFLPYQTNKDNSQKTACTHQKITKKKFYDPCFVGSAEILVIFGLHFGRNDDTLLVVQTVCTKLALISLSSMEPIKHDHYTIVSCFIFYAIKMGDQAWQSGWVIHRGLKPFL